MRALINLYRRLDRLQQDKRIQLAMSVLVVLGCGLFFGVLLVKSYDLDAQRQALVAALTNQSVPERDEHALTLFETGEVFVGGRTYGGPEFLEYRALVFDQQGTVANTSALAERLLVDQRPAWAPDWMLDQPSTTWLLAVVMTVWGLLIIWLVLTAPFLLTLLGTAIPVGVLLLLKQPLGDPRWLDHFSLYILGLGLLTFTFVLLTRLALISLGSPVQVFAVAHSVVKEAARTNISLVFIILLLVGLPLLAIRLDEQLPLRYQVQTFISRSMGLTFLLAACLTLVLSCATVAFEIRDRQIWQLVTKPVSRLKYLLGKWLGVVVVNLIILLVSGLSTFTFIQYLRARPVAPGMAGQLDALAVRDEILTARVAVRPDYELLTGQQLVTRVEQTIERTPELVAMEQVPAHTRNEIARGLQETFLIGQRTIPPGMARNFEFSGLDRLADQSSTLTLRYRFHILRSDEHETYRAVFWFNEDQNLAVRRTYVPTVSHILSIPPGLIREDGTLTVTVANAYQPPPEMRGFGALNFEHDDFEVLYKVGSFGPNFFRAVLLNWIKLSFLAMLGIACSTILSFSVACLLAFTIFVAGAMGPFLAESLEMWYPPPTAQMDWSNVGLVIKWAFQWFVKGVAEVVVFGLRGFGQYSATQLLVEGRFIPWRAVTMGFMQLGVLWSGTALVVGYLVMRTRQLAIYSGQG